MKKEFYQFLEETMDGRWQRSGMWGEREKKKSKGEKRECVREMKKEKRGEGRRVWGKKGNKEKISKKKKLRFKGYE